MFFTVIHFLYYAIYVEIIEIVNSDILCHYNCIKYKINNVIDYG